MDALKRSLLKYLVTKWHKIATIDSWGRRDIKRVHQRASSQMWVGLGMSGQSPSRRSDGGGESDYGASEKTIYRHIDKAVWRPRPLRTEPSGRFQNQSDALSLSVSPSTDVALRWGLVTKLQLPLRSVKHPDTLRVHHVTNSPEKYRRLTMCVSFAT